MRNLWIMAAGGFPFSAFLQKDFLYRFLEKTYHFLKIYIREYYPLLVFLMVFVSFYILFMHWLNIRLLNRLREPAALFCLGVELTAIVFFTLMFRETMAGRIYALEPFWSYKAWILGGNAVIGMDNLNNILLFFPFGFVLTDAFRKCPFWAVLISSLIISGTVETCQLIFQIGTFDVDDIMNNVLGALAGWITFHILRGSRSGYKA